MPEATQPTLVRSLVRGLDILHLLAESSDGLSLGEIAAAMGLKPPTAHNLLRTLSFRGFVEKTSSPVRYRIGPGLAQLAGLSAQRELVRRAESMMLRLGHEVPGATVSFSEPSGTDVLQTMRVAPEGPPRITHLRRRAVMSPYASASALAFQAFAAPAAIDAFRREHPFWEEAAALWSAPAKLDGFLDESRAGGCVVAHFPGETLYKTAAPVYEPQGELAALLGISYPAADVPENTRRNRMRRLMAAAKSISDTGDGAC